MDVSEAKRLKVLEQENAHVMSAERIHADDTRVPVLANLKSVNWLDLPFAGHDPPAALFYYSRNRAGEHPQSHLCHYVFHASRCL